MRLPLTGLILQKRHRSRVETAILPLGSIRKALVLIDSTEEGYGLAEKEVRDFFEGLGIEALIVCPTKKDLDIVGRVRRKIIAPGGAPFAEDLFISLYPVNRFETRYEAICSPARFKIGRDYIKGDIFNIVVRNPEGSSPSQSEAFGTIRDLLEKIR